MLELRKSDDRGKADHGWLQSRHTFSFADYFDPKQMGFSDLLVINDDIVAPQRGFGTHPHENMEIFTYVLEGELEHKDSMGTGSTIRPGDVQSMSAGTGVRHSEFNPSNHVPVHLLQIWIVPDRGGVAPRYQQRTFSDAEKSGKLCKILSPNGEGGSLELYQDSVVYAARLDGTEAIDHTPPPDRFGYVHVARGQMKVNGIVLATGDGLKLRYEKKLRFTDGQGAEFLYFDLRPKEEPEFVD